MAYPAQAMYTYLSNAFASLMKESTMHKSSTGEPGPQSKPIREYLVRERVSHPTHRAASTVDAVKTNTRTP